MIEYREFIEAHIFIPTKKDNTLPSLKECIDSFPQSKAHKLVVHTFYTEKKKQEKKYRPISFSYETFLGEYRNGQKLSDMYSGLWGSKGISHYLHKRKAKVIEFLTKRKLKKFNKESSFEEKKYFFGDCVKQGLRIAQLFREKYPFSEEIDKWQEGYIKPLSRKELDEMDIRYIANTVLENIWNADEKSKLSIYIPDNILFR